MAATSSQTQTTKVEGANCGYIEGDIDKQPVMVVLYGLPGAGKSQFCFDLFEEEKQDLSSRWTVICQDKLGSRERCIQEATRALSSGHRVVVDRCNGTV